MAMTVETLPDDPQTLKKIILDLQSKNDYLMEQFRLARQKRFSASSESAPDQIQLFNEAEQESNLGEPEAEPQIECESTNVSEPARKKPVRTSLPKELPRQTIVVDLSEEEKVCPCCQGQLHKIGQESREQLEFIPAQIKVIETIRPKYGCRTCKKTILKRQ